MDKDIYLFWKKQNQAPYHFPMDYDTWLKSWETDTDSEGKPLFSRLCTDLYRNRDGGITGLIQYGTTAFGFDAAGELSENVHYCVIRSLCFEKPEAGSQLLRRALSSFPPDDRVYAFFHFFGMSACARHGKLHEHSTQVHHLLIDNGFLVEHENVYYAKDLPASLPSEQSLLLQWQEPSPSGHRQFAATIQGEEVCWGEIHFLPQGDIAYLRWIYVAEDRQHTGIGSRVIQALFAHLSGLGIHRFDTDTARSNETAQQFYEKNGFRNMGITRSYHTP